MSTILRLVRFILLPQLDNSFLVGFRKNFFILKQQMAAHFFVVFIEIVALSAALVWGLGSWLTIEQVAYLWPGVVVIYSYYKAFTQSREVTLLEFSEATNRFTRGLPISKTSLAMSHIAYGCIFGLMTGTIFNVIGLIYFGFPFKGILMTFFLVLVIALIASAHGLFSVSAISMPILRRLVGPLFLLLGLFSGAIFPLKSIKPAKLAEFLQLNPLVPIIDGVRVSFLGLSPGVAFLGFGITFLLAIVAINVATKCFSDAYNYWVESSFM